MTDDKMTPPTLQEYGLTPEDYARLHGRRSDRTEWFFYLTFFLLAPVPGTILARVAFRDHAHATALTVLCAATGVYFCMFLMSTAHHYWRRYLLTHSDVHQKSDAYDEALKMYRYRHEMREERVGQTGLDPLARKGSFPTFGFKLACFLSALCFPLVLALFLMYVSHEILQGTGDRAVVFWHSGSLLILCGALYFPLVKGLHKHRRRH
jgi:hypothetical protein